MQVDILTGDVVRVTVQCAELWAEWVGIPQVTHLTSFLLEASVHLQDQLQSRKQGDPIVWMTVPRKSCPACPPAFEPPPVVQDLLKRLGLPLPSWDAPRATSLVLDGSLLKLFQYIPGGWEKVVHGSWNPARIPWPAQPKIHMEQHIDFAAIPPSEAADDLVEALEIMQRHVLNSLMVPPELVR